MLKWTKTQGMWYADINRTSFYRISEIGRGFTLAELYENKPYYATKKLGNFVSLAEAKARAESRQKRRRAIKK